MSKSKILKITVCAIILLALIFIIFATKTTNAETETGIIGEGDGIIEGEVTICWSDFYNKYGERPDTVTITLENRYNDSPEVKGEYDSISFTVDVKDAKQTYNSNGITYWVFDYEVNPEWLTKAKTDENNLPDLYLSEVEFDDKNGSYIKNTEFNVSDAVKLENITYDSETQNVICGNFNVYPTYKETYVMNITVNFDDGDYRDNLRNLEFELEYTPTNGEKYGSDVFWSYYEYDSDFFTGTENTFTFSVGDDYEIYRYDIDYTADSFGEKIKYTMINAAIYSDDGDNLFDSGEYTYDYSFDENGDLTINVSHTPETVSKTVEVVWDDGDNTNRLRPDSITVKAVDTEGNTVATFTISSSEDWKTVQAFFKNLKYSGGEEITKYTLEVEEDENYTFTVSSSNSTSYKITGTFFKLLPDGKEEYKDIDITVIFDDDDNRDYTRLGFEFRLSATNTTQSTGFMFSFNSSDFDYDTNTFKFTNNTIAQYISYWNDPNFGELVEYDGSFPEISSNVNYDWEFDDDGNVIIYISSKAEANTFNTNIDVSWDDEDNENRVRPDTLTVYALNQNNEVESTIIVNSSEDWTTVAELFNNLKWSSGKTAIEYTLQVAGIDNYEFAISGNTTDGFSIVGTYVETVEEVEDPVEEDEEPEEVVTEGSKAEEESVTETEEIDENENPGTSDNFNIYIVLGALIVGILGTVTTISVIRKELKK